VIRVAIITVSDSIAHNERQDITGVVVAARCTQYGWHVLSRHVTADEEATLRALLTTLADSTEFDLILTAGGTGIGPRDVTPEAARAICSKLLPGFGELMREAGRDKTPRAALSRAVAGVRATTLLVNLPGSPKGAIESLEAVAELIPHAIEVLHGARHD
jgi:molybdenum cofactor synthesis domain-containing protein